MKNTRSIPSSKSVRLTKSFVEMNHYTQDPFSPHPPFPQFHPWDVYPYPNWGVMQKRVVRQKYFMPALENDFVRLTIAADIGGRIWDIYDKINGRHLANFNTEVHASGGGMAKHYVTGGIECNYPTAHSCTTGQKREISYARGADGSASIIMSELDRVWGTRWSSAYTLYPDRSFVEVRIRIYNRTPFDTRYLYWNNCGFVLNNDTEFILPEDAGSMHGKEVKTFSWPIWKHMELNYWRNSPPDALGLYMLDAREPYFGYYEHKQHFGLVHYADLADLPGKKYWTWGNGEYRVSRMRKTHHSSGEVYGEIQSGRIVVQEHKDRVPPETVCEWKQYWSPVRGTGGINGAGPGAVMKIEALKSDARRSLLKVSVLGNGSFPKSKIIVVSDGTKPLEQPVALDARNAVERVIEVRGKIGPDQHTAVMVQDSGGEYLASARLRHPNKRDSWREVIEVRQQVRAVGVEELFREAEIKARDWSNPDLKPFYEQAIKQDEAFSPARLELGKIALRRGLYEEALNHLRIAHKRDEDSFEIRYFLGLAQLYTGKIEDAKQSFELANRYHWEAPSLVRLAELFMRQRDWCHALDYLERLMATYPKLSRPPCLAAICLRKLGKNREAAEAIARALQIDAQDPFLQFEEDFIKSGVRRPSAAFARALTEHVRGQEPPVLEAAFDYLEVGLHAEACAVMAVIPQPGPLALFTLAWVQEQMGDKRSSATLRKACAADPTGHNPWHLQMIPILQWACKNLPKEPRPVYLLGSLLFARRRTDEGVALWKQAEKMGEKHFVLFSNLGYYERLVANNSKAAYEYFNKAAQSNPKDLDMKLEVFNGLNADGKFKEAVLFLERQMDTVLSSPPLANGLMTSYLNSNDYAKYDALAAKVDFAHNYGLPGPHHTWQRRQLQEALQCMKDNRLARALEILKNFTCDAPPNMGVDAYARGPANDRVYYHMGRVYEKMGKMAEARQCWEKALTVWHGCYYEPAYWFSEWQARYFQALCLQKLGREGEANAYFDAMELLAENTELPLGARKSIMAKVELGRFAPEEEKDPGWKTREIEVATRASL